ncbi:SpaA isopeptide-forming pilin-related protein [Flintibacter muris]|uniref:SpaA isopeptide-forming pilin-related protein n=1 Tax=Flintibacter muris TaxID=2941327 RepID=UPI0030B9B048
MPEGTPIKYTAPDTVSDPKVCGIIANGYPHEPLSTLNLNTPEEAYYATKTALWIYLLSNWSVNGLGINPRLTGEDRAAAQRVLEATRTIYNRGMGWNSIPSPKFTATADKDVAYPVTINGQPYYQQIITISSDTWTYQKAKLSLADGAPAGAKILDMNDQEISELTMSTYTFADGHKGQCKIIYPASSVAGQTGTVQLNMDTVVVQYQIYYAKSLQADQYGNIQDYMLDTDPYLQMEGSFISRYSADPDDPPPPSSETAIKVIKLETGTLTPLEGAVFKITAPDGTTLGSYSTQRDGTFTVPVTQTGHYTVEELSPPKWHLISGDATQHVQAVHGKTVEVTFYNDPYGNLRVEKYSDTGEPLKGVTIQIKHIATGETRSAQTGPGGAVEFTELKPDGWEVRETAGIEGWIADTDTVQTMSVVSGQESTVTFTNKELPGLKIIKYDRTTLKVMTDIAFEIWRDGESLGQYSTNQQGEILITNAKPGTYLVKEVQSDDEHVTDATPQQVELHAGDGIKELVFFNGKKPGIHLVKVDSANLSKPIPNVKFSIRAVDGTFGPKEFTTDKNGEIDLSRLSPGAYEVLELECPGYVIDKAQRIIQLEADRNAEFVFTNSKYPDLLLTKTSSDVSPLAGVSFRLAKIEDGSRYLDRTTNAKGEILWEGLEPGVYSLKETATVADHILDIREYHVELFPGKVSTIAIENQKRPNLVVYKHDADTGEAVPDTVFLVKAADGHSVDEIKTDSQGKATLSNLLPGVYEISEKSVPAPWLMDAPSQLVTLYPNRDHTVYFENHKKPTLTVNKVDSITKSPIKGAKFEVWYGSNSTTTGELNSLGTFFSDENGQFSLDLLRDGWYRVTELAPAAGYTIKQPATQEFYIKGGESKVITFENVPKNAIIVEKYDSVTGAALPGCTFQLRYLGGTSGTGGTVIGTKVTGKNGTAMWTGLNPGAYVLEEVDAADGYNIIQSSETIMLADSGEQSVVTVRFSNAPDGILLIRKVCSVNPSVTLQNAEFKVLYADGTVVGDSNGVYRTDENGEIRITGLTPGKSVVVTETRAPAGFILDTQSQTVQIKEGRTVSLTFKNQPKGAIIIQKRDSVTGQPLPGAEFRVTTAAGCEVGLDGVIGTSTLTQNGIFTTDAQGEIKITNLAPGAYILSEIKAPTGYVMDRASTNVVIGQGGDTQTVIVKNSKAGTLVIDKRDALTGKPLKGVTFKVTTSTGEFVPAENGQISSNGLYFTDKDGKITINGVVGTLVVTETATIPGYTIDEATRTQTVVVNPNDTQTLHFTNTPSTTLVIEKYIEGTTTPLKGVTFLVTDSSGAVVGNSNGEFITDEAGRIVLDGLTPGTTVTAREIKALEGYVLDGQPKSILSQSGRSPVPPFLQRQAGLYRGEEAGQADQGAAGRGGVPDHLLGRELSGRRLRPSVQQGPL